LQLTVGDFKSNEVLLLIVASVVEEQALLHTRGEAAKIIKVGLTFMNIEQLMCDYFWACNE
jgi:hypothetical protein